MRETVQLSHLICYFSLCFTHHKWLINWEAVQFVNLNDERSVLRFFRPRRNPDIVVSLKLYLVSNRETKGERTERGRGKIFDGSDFYYLSILRFYLALFRLTLSLSYRWYNLYLPRYDLNLAELWCGSLMSVTPVTACDLVSPLNNLTYTWRTVSICLHRTNLW